MTPPPPNRPKHPTKPQKVTPPEKKKTLRLNRSKGKQVMLLRNPNPTNPSLIV